MINSQYNAAYKNAATTKAYQEATDNFERECVSKFFTREELIDCLQDKIATAREPQRAEEDLNAQIAMADWALAVLIVTSTLGVLTLIITGQKRKTKFCHSIQWTRVGSDEMITGHYADRHNEAT